MARGLIIAALLATAAVGSYGAVHAHNKSPVRSAAASGAWDDLFQPPYTNTPTVMMALSCISHNACYVPAGENGVGFNTYLFDNVPNGIFQPLNMEETPIMMMAISIGGTPANPKGAVGGMGFGDGVAYMVNATDFRAAATPFMVVTQDIEASATGTEIVVVDQANVNEILLSTNAGVSFVEKPFNTPTPANCTYARYSAVADANTFYVTLGSWPNNNKDKIAKDAIFQSERVYITRDPKTGKVTRNTRSFLGSKAAAKDEGFSSSSSSSSHSSGSGGYSIYTAQIVKTTDGGNTWTSLFSAATNFYFNGITCINANTCFAVGEGFDQSPAAYIYATYDGKTWNVVHTEPSSGSAMNSLMSIRAVNGTIIAAGGTETTFGGSSLILESTDNGKTWIKMNALANIVDISDLDMLDDGYAYATAMTVYQTCTILRYTPGNAPPSPPAPTQAFFSQTQCTDTNCSVGCQTATFGVGVCLQVSGGGSATVQCTPTELVQNFYQSSDCSGTAQVQKEPLNKCLQDQSGGSFVNQCGSSAADEAVVASNRRLMRE